MSGITATLVWQGISVPGGYVDVHNVIGGPSYCVDPDSFPNGSWVVYLYYYKDLATRQADINSNIAISDESYTQFEVPYISGSDPVQQALAVLQEWFPEGTPVP